jgi:hypothetical protein
MTTSIVSAYDATTGAVVAINAAYVAGVLSDAAQSMTFGPVACTTLVASGLATLGSVKVDTGTKTAAATAGAATLNKNAGVITSEALTTAAGATYTLTLTNSAIAAADQVLVTVGNGTNSAGQPNVTTVTPGAGSVVIVMQNIHASAALNGTIKFSFVVHKN